MLVEKPLAYSLDDAVATIGAARRTGKILHTGFWQRWQPNIQAAKRIVDSGALGELYYAQMIGGGRRRIPGGSFLRRDMAGAGPIVDIGCYNMDTFLFLAGDPRPVSVSAMLSYHLGKSLPNVPGDWGHDPAAVEVEDFSAAFVRFENGMVLNFVIYWAAHTDDLGPSTLLGTRGGLQLSPDLVLFRDEFGVLTNVKPKLPDLSEPGSAAPFHASGAAFRRRGPRGWPIARGSRTILLSQVIMDGMYRSAAAGREVTLEVPTIE